MITTVSGDNIEYVDLGNGIRIPGCPDGVRRAHGTEQRYNLDRMHSTYCLHPRPMSWSYNHINEAILP